ncbi:MAG: glycosyl hydrolase, partial [Chloroflexi bacterium]|nr:glycosyl hydrolase [Chloroflexota bacterium]
MAVAGDPVEQHVLYFGSTGGGVWKTVDGGTYWTNVSDGFFRRASVGALEVAPADRTVIYAGMGESCIRGDVAHGDGVYRSTDAGATWTHLGLADTRHIGKIRSDPRDADTVFVAALGHAHGPSRERGLYRSRDGGRTWTKVLDRGPNAGAIDVSIDARNPRNVYAATWEAIRLPWIVSSGGPGSGIFRSTDGGSTWTDLTRMPGLPAGIIGRVGVAASPARAGRVFAVIEAEQGGLYRSDDGGSTWVRGSGDSNLYFRGYYYCHIVADPSDPDTVWVMNGDLWRSVDAGATFQRVPTPHGDNHDLWIDPRDSRRMIVGCDGGAGVTFTAGASWSRTNNQPTAELYRVVADARVPYHVYGAQQDSGTIAVPSRSALAAIPNGAARDVGGGESGWIAVRPDDPHIVYAGNFAGELTRYDERTGQSAAIDVHPEMDAWGSAASTVKHRFGWSHPIVLSPHDANALYVCAERVFRTEDEGTTWRAISPDLTLNDTGRLEPGGNPARRDAPMNERERVGTIYSFAESAVKPGVLWAGTDDGKVQTSRDGGSTWLDVTPRAVKEWTLVSCVEPSAHDPRRAYLAVTRYLLDDFAPMLFRTRDGGRTWTSIVAGLPADVFTRVIREDPVVPGLLFCGTETGVHVSFDDGESWSPLKGNLPTVPIYDLIVKDGDLVVATHGRGFWILDDMTALRDSFARVARGVAPHLFAPRPYQRLGAPRTARAPSPGHNYRIEGAATVTYTPLAEEGDVAEDFLDASRNPPRGVVVRYFLPKDAAAVALVISDARGGEVRRFTSGARPAPATSAGLHRFVWDTRLDGPADVPAAAPAGVGRAAVPSSVDFFRGERPPAGPLAVPGTYSVRIEVDGAVRSASFEIQADPGTGVSQADLVRQEALLLRLRDAFSSANRTLGEVRALRVRLTALETLGRANGQALRARLDAI